MTMPYSRIAELMALRMKNFMLDSVERLVRRNAARAAIGRAVSSRAMKIVIRFVVDARSIMPVVENNIRA